MICVYRARSTNKTTMTHSICVVNVGLRQRRGSGVVRTKLMIVPLWYVCCCFCRFLSFYSVLRQINLWRRKVEPTHIHTHTRIRAHEPVIKCERRRWKKNIHHYTTTRVHISKSAPTKTNWNNTKIKRWYAVRSHAQQCTRPSLVRAIWTEHLFAHLHSRVAGAAAVSSLFLRNAEDKTSERNEFIHEICVWVCGSGGGWWVVPHEFSTPKPKSFREKTATIPPLTLIIWYNFHFTRTDYKNKWKLLLIWIWCEQQQNQQFKFYAFQKNCEFRFKNKTQSNEWGKWNCR